MYELITKKDLTQKKYLSVFEQTNLSLLDGYDVKQILFNETAYCLNISWKRLLKEIIKSLFFKNYNLECHLSGQDILLLYSKNYRTDHDTYWKKIEYDVKKNDSITILTNEGRTLSAENISRKIKYLISFNKELSGIKFLKHRWYFSIRLVDRKIVLDEVDSLQLSPKVTMCFSDNSADETVLMQYFKMKGSVTVTNQHGLCIFQSYDYDRLNQSQLLNFKCDYFLARGVKQKEQFVLAGYSPDRIKVVGYIGACNRDIYVQETISMGIYLDCPTVPLSKNNNESMIKIGKQIACTLKMKYLIKCHPQDLVENYKELADENCLGIYGKGISLDETFKKVDICITHASATYVDVYIYGLRCLKMNSAIRYPIAVKEDEFETAEEAIDKITKWNDWSLEKKRRYIQGIREAYASPWVDGNINKALQIIMEERFN